MLPATDDTDASADFNSPPSSGLGETEPVVSSRLRLAIGTPNGNNTMEMKERWHKLQILSLITMFNVAMLLGGQNISRNRVERLGRKGTLS